MLNKIIRFLLLVYCLLCCLLFMTGVMYLFAQSLYGNFTIRQFVFHFAVISTMDISLKLIIFVLLAPLLLGFMILFALKKPLLWLRHYVAKDTLDKIQKHDNWLSFITSTLSVAIIVGTISAFSYPLPQIFKQAKFSIETLYSSKQYDTIIEDNFANPAQIQFTAKHPKNLIVIFTESMEQTFADSNLLKDNLLSNLMQQNGTSILGQTELSETSWTYAGMVATLCGITDKVYIPPRGLSENIVCISDVLQQNGYNLHFIKGTPLKFSGTGYFLQNHSFENVYGIDELPQLSDENIYEIKFIGRTLEDSVMLDIFKKQIKQLAEQPAPFMAVALTANTHPYHGHTEKQCSHKYNDMRDSISCVDSILASFAEWFQKQDFAADTTLVILGDHLMMFNDIQKYLDKSPKREIFNMVWGYAAPQENTKRQFNQFDWAPTLLEMAGFEWNGHKFGLGTSLLSGESTMQEIYKDELNSRLIKNSKLYEEKLVE